ncbi:MAG: hypothetical protein FD161_3165 [Limisphaerales bacterium]|nr:MAG: hypothetical protein FD161_3165 [Limisphaerales bacterium]TXT49151.1 MAG: hypothetical protein FD140_3260 [Limisphaerales bacterium]
MPEMPADILALLEQAQGAATALYDLAAQSGLNLEFTLDGRFVGDVGELLAVRNFAVKLYGKQGQVHDGTCVIKGREQGVQVKCRRASTVIDFTSQPELLLALSVAEDWRSWDVVYNGPADFLTNDKVYSMADDRKLMKGNVRKARRIDLDQLADLQRQMVAESPRVPPKNT